MTIDLLHTMRYCAFTSPASFDVFQNLQRARDRDEVPPTEPLAPKQQRTPATK
jgi:hypothetical protein